MFISPVRTEDALGRSLILRSAEASDAEMLIRHLKITAGETRFLTREPEEICYTPKQEQSFVLNMMASRREVLIVAMLDGELAGTCALMSRGHCKRLDHRCEIAIALYKKYWGAGIGNKMMQRVLSLAKELGYEQAELEVMADNKGAIALYEKLGFSQWGWIHQYMKYADGTYADAVMMGKLL